MRSTTHKGRGNQLFIANLLGFRLGDPLLYRLGDITGKFPGLGPQLKPLMNKEGMEGMMPLTGAGRRVTVF